MSLADYYRVLGLRSGAAFDDVKAAYRRLARRYHPDMNPGDQRAKDKFIQVTQAYQALAEVLMLDALPPGKEPVPIAEETAPASGTPTAKQNQPSSTPTSIPKVQVTTKLSPADHALKQQLYEQLQSLVQAQRLPRAIALVEGLAQRFPQDLEVRQWQAITYQRWGRALMQKKEWEKAERYLEKSLRTDPHNKALWREVGADLRRLSQVKSQVPLP